MRNGSRLDPDFLFSLDLGEKVCTWSIFVTMLLSIRISPCFDLASTELQPRWIRATSGEETKQGHGGLDPWKKHGVCWRAGRPGQTHMGEFSSFFLVEWLIVCWFVVFFLFPPHPDLICPGFFRCAGVLDLICDLIIFQSVLVIFFLRWSSCDLMVLEFQIMIASGYLLFFSNLFCGFVVHVPRSVPISVIFHGFCLSFNVQILVQIFYVCWKKWFWSN